MKKALVDTNVVLDIFLRRQAFLTSSLAVWTAVENRMVDGYLSAHAVTTIAYVAHKTHGAATLRMIEQLLRVFRVATVDSKILHQALRLSNPDFEDCVTAAAAQAAGCDFIVTRDPAGFRDSQVRSLSPHAFVALL